MIQRIPAEPVPAEVATGTVTRGMKRLSIPFLVAISLAIGLMVASPAVAVADHPGRVDTDGGLLQVRSGPGTHHRSIGSLRDGARVLITCQINGTQQTGTFGTSRLWDRLSSGGFVADVYVNTGFDGRIAPTCPAGKGRTAARKLTMSPKGLEFLGTLEGFRAKPYNDATANCTIAFGHLIHRGLCTTADHAKWGTITKSRGLQVLRSDVKRFVTGLHRQVPRTALYQHEFDALVSFTFNIGLGGFGRSKVKEDLLERQPNYRAVPKHMLNWTNHGHCGLTSRRLNEGRLFATANYHITWRHC